jgi:iron complex outermembrane receptor protein
VAGVRWDWTEFVVGDRIATPADASDRFRYRELSPRIGLHWKPADAVLTYANLATAFRVPTTTEFAPGALQRGFDDSLEPEHTVGVELGARGLVSDWLLYEAVLFELHLRDALIPFQDATGQQRARNAAEVRRRGFELGASALLHPWLSLRTAYTWSHFRYRDYDVVNALAGTVTSFDGEREPNVPEHSLAAELRFEHPSGAFATAALRLFTDLEVNDANTLESPGGVISDLRAGWTLHRGALAIEPFAGLRNWTGVEYDGTLRPNANAGRYFEPNAEIEVYSGLAIRLGR